MIALPLTFYFPDTTCPPREVVSPSQPAPAQAGHPLSAKSSTACDSPGYPPLQAQTENIAAAAARAANPARPEKSPAEIHRAPAHHIAACTPPAQNHSDLFH